MQPRQCRYEAVWPDDERLAAFLFGKALEGWWLVGEEAMESTLGLCSSEEHAHGVICEV